MLVAKQSALGKALKKKTGALTVSVEFERLDDSDSTENDLLVLSLRLRQMKVAAVWTSRSVLGPSHIHACVHVRAHAHTHTQEVRLLFRISRSFPLYAGKLACGW